LFARYTGGKVSFFFDSFHCGVAKQLDSGASSHCAEAGYTGEEFAPAAVNPTTARSFQDSGKVAYFLDLAVCPLDRLRPSWLHGSGEKPS